VDIYGCKDEVEKDECYKFFTGANELSLKVLFFDLVNEENCEFCDNFIKSVKNFYLNNWRAVMYKLKFSASNKTSTHLLKSLNILSSLKKII